MTPRIGSLCTGYGGLDLGVQAAVGGHTVWVSDIDKGARTLLAHRYPGVPNLGDLTRTDWSTVEPVDVLTAGFPCQPVSNAGKRLGADDERWLWDDVARAVSELRPGLLIVENVRGLLTAGRGRLFGRVLGTLAVLGYDAEWVGVRAADVGAPHGRWRVFLAATGTHHGTHDWQRSRPEPWEGDRTVGPLLPSPRTSDTNGAGAHGDGGLDLRTAVSMLPTPTARDWKNAGDPAKTAGRMAERGQPLTEVAVNVLLPTPAVNDMGEGKTVEAWDEWTAKMKAAHGNGNGHGASLAIEAQRHLNQWGPYAAAVARWEALTRPAPSPTETGQKGKSRLSPAFSEWMMGLPAGWITDVPGLTRSQQLKLAGNGVVPQQAEAAARLLLATRIAVAV